jgi:hypothetical protein
MAAHFVLLALIVIVVAVGIVLGRGVERMPQKLKVFFGIVGLCIMAMYGAYWLIQWYNTGTLWVNFRNAGEPNNYQLISFDDYPVTFIVTFSAHVLFVLVGSLGFVAIFRKLRTWIRTERGG